MSEPRDLSAIHHPIGGLFEQPTSPEAWAEFQLSEAQVRFFEENGYLSGVRILTDEQVDALNDELDIGLAHRFE